MYADDNQVYIVFKLKTPHEVIDIINECISDLRTWMIINKLNINDDIFYIFYFLTSLSFVVLQSKAMFIICHLLQS